MNTAITELQNLKKALESGKYKFVGTDGCEYDLLSSINKALEYEESIPTPYISVFSDTNDLSEYVNKKEFLKEVLSKVRTDLIPKAYEETGHTLTYYLYQIAKSFGLSGVEL